MKKILTLLCALLCACAIAEDMKQRLQNAENFYLQGLQAEKDNDRHKAMELWKLAVDAYNDVLATPNFDNAKIRCNLANAYLAQKKLGLAILNYRLASQLEPDNGKIEANLALARSFRKDNLEANEQDRILKTLFTFHYDLAFTTRRTIFIAAYAILFATIAIRIILRKPHPALTTLIAITAFVSLVFAASIGVDAFTQKAHHGVITANVVHAKAGSSNSYQDAFQAPLHDGTEFTLIDMDDTRQWLHVTLENQAECWLPATSAAIME